MFVINRMTKNPITVTPDAKIDEVSNLIKVKKIRRMADFFICKYGCHPWGDGARKVAPINKYQFM